ncbi:MULTISPECIES: bifunctional 3,4-dihydroxy-2-butanone-4-phosphate synthase/GTP cyclohydrolase II [unclassified Neisseria]|uniref:bifunctional 3,4-dihydroxy-2-butanone-4-phosphate synthase/GTP cyclohydrolase II n=1 Tax=unclassified Neisseria TaxID=2623750 RepID=UPI002666C409|nr:MULTISPECIES: bifunctional 3,4-dihydroxy-2-butanone-4-phosphate synthase/GTP cyclohydrolase II [unclassified Neisseria]MDO1508893.1 bifunctional 3,4-dihydroxy-2-butanone-4-phosphate synthase/GTP cyclohydrolase II [Neisseria sp. MVDL19-042950]MDO1515152.1 bifunctional 3,4-dihydroxy-2-butanone-4-phosphate synthase/GTP cyclohydrolase II [Neisseria sp. MVDL18-041461]MDO1562512.1 bifunctional 3,4-dihydroxy-2-butanone-4-phosphate synthase/GTP cyclohydrolase II [Neisseria sp. MVDL20-010259]
MDTVERRRHNLRQWIARLYGGQQAQFVAATAINQGELSALLKNKSFGEKKARKIEQTAGMPAMWLDTDHGDTPTEDATHTSETSTKMSHISPISEILADIKAGKMVIITDAEDRENEGDLLMAAQFVTPEAVNFMIKYARGLVCLPMNETMVEKLGLPMMTQKNGAQYGTNFTVSIEAAHGISTGISAADRALTIQTAVSPNAKPEDIVQPGHIFPLRAQKGGVLVRAGHTEAGVDLAQMCGLIPAAVICEIINDDGTMARMPELLKFAEEHNLKIGTITDLIEYRSRTESLLEEMGDMAVQTPWGDFQQHVYVDKLSGETHLALVKGMPETSKETLVRVHEPFSVMDFLQTNPRHSWSLPASLQRIQQAESGVIILLHRTETGATLLDRTLPKGMSQTRKWDSKTYGIGAQILANLNVKKMRVMGKPSSFTGLTGFGLEVVGFEEADDNSDI